MLIIITMFKGIIDRTHMSILHSPTSIFYSPPPISTSSSSSKSSTDEGSSFRSLIEDILAGKRNPSLAVDTTGIAGKIGENLMRFGAWKWEEDANGK